MHNLKGKKVLVTGGAGFIGSNLVETLLNLGARVAVFDNLETGHKKNLQDFIGRSDFELIEGDISIAAHCEKAVQGVDVISHQAALGSVPRSISFPHRTHEVNGTGFLNMLHAAKEAGVKRFVFASSSSVYGDSTISPKTIGSEGNLLSPYAVTKDLNEQYAAVYARLHGMETIGLRYFNVFGAKQDPFGVYAAAIPRFIEAMLQGGKITINGDGEQTHDFTYVKNAVKANVLALTTDNTETFGKVYNVACGEYFTLNSVVNSIKEILIEQKRFNAKTIIENGPDRMGDIKHSLADISETIKDLGYSDIYQFNEGIKEYLSKKD